MLSYKTYRTWPVFSFYVPDSVHDESIAVSVRCSTLQAHMTTARGLTTRTLFLVETCTSDGLQHNVVPTAHRIQLVYIL